MGDRDVTLLACPFCGGTSYVAVVDDYGSSFSVKCNNPICGGAVRLWATRDRAIAAWNRRASPTDGTAVDTAKVRQDHPSKPPEQRGEERLTDARLVELLGICERATPGAWTATMTEENEPSSPDV